MRALAVAAVLLLLLAGCSHRGAPRPEDWQTGAALVAFGGGKTHAADEVYTLRPPAAMPVPAACIAYQDALREDGDSCAVVPQANATWTLVATWAGKWQTLQDVEAHPERRTVVATDAAGAVVAYWDGMARAPDGAFYTE